MTYTAKQKRNFKRKAQERRKTRAQLRKRR